MGIRYPFVNLFEIVLIYGYRAAAAAAAMTNPAVVALSRHLNYNSHRHLADRPYKQTDVRTANPFTNNRNPDQRRRNSLSSVQRQKSNSCAGFLTLTVLKVDATSHLWPKRQSTRILKYRVRILGSVTKFIGTKGRIPGLGTI